MASRRRGLEVRVDRTGSDTTFDASENFALGANKSPQSRPVAIVGMHRSGTSMVAKLLQQAGLNLGDEGDLMPPAAENPEGSMSRARDGIVPRQLDSTGTMKRSIHFERVPGTWQHHCRSGSPGVGKTRARA
jgi:hypothetical protein